MREYITNGILALKAVVAGAHWNGDVLMACGRALTMLGAVVTLVATNIRTSRAHRLDDLSRDARALPLIGSIVARGLERRSHESLVEQVRQTLSETLREAKPQIFVALVDGRYPVLPDVLCDFPSVYKIAWMMDDPFAYFNPASRGLDAFDRLYTVEESLVLPLLLATGRPVRSLPLAADPSSYYPFPAAARHELVFIGKSYRNSPEGLARALLLSRVSQYGLSIWGDSGWKGLRANAVDLGKYYRGGPLPPAETNAVYNSAAVAVNVLHPQIRCGTSLRTFSICAAGGFQLVDWRPGLDAMLEPDSEVVTYSSGDEFVEKTQHYLGDELARHRIAERGRARVLADHTYVNRVREVLHDAGL